MLHNVKIIMDDETSGKDKPDPQVTISGMKSSSSSFTLSFSSSLSLALSKELQKCLSLSSAPGSVLIDIHIRAEQADFCAACQAQLMQGSGEERRSGSKE